MLLQLSFWGLLLFTISNSLSASAQACTGAPNPGNTIASTITPCPGVTDSFSIQNYASLGTGLSYQWHTGSGLVTGATNATHTMVISGSSATVWCEITCLSSGITASSTPITVNVSGFLNCYCISRASSVQDEDIYNVTLNGNSTDPLYSLSNGCSTVAPGPGSILKEYSNFRSLPPLANLSQGVASTFSILQDDCDGAPYFANRIGIWIDFNHNANFEPSENVYLETIAIVGPRTVSGTFVVPATALTGNTVMRIVCSEYLSPVPSPCGIYFYGETEDYLVNIAAGTPSCTGAPNPGATIASATSVCPGGSAALSLQFPPTATSLISLQWFNNAGAIAGATNSTYTASITATDIFYCTVTCISTGTIMFSSPVTVQLNVTSTGASTYASCDSYLWNGNTVTASGTYVGTFTNAFGCDSLHTLNLIINHSTSSSLTQTGCDYYLFNSTVYTTSGTYSHTMTNVNGCDSIIQLNLTINQSTDSTINAVSCNMFSINGQTYTNTGTYTQNYTNAVGCDSVVNLQIDIDTLNATITINGLSISTPNVGTYQWIDCNSNTPIPGATSLNFVPTASGSYAVIVSTATCVDTSVCLTMWLTGTNNVNLNGNASIYPNPTQGVFDIELIDDGAFTIMNNLGEIVLQQRATKGTHTIDITAFAKGIYFLKIEEKNNTDILKLLKE